MDLPVRSDGNRIDDHAAFRLLDLVDLQGLPFHRHGLVNHGEPPFLCEGDPHAGLRYGIHGGAEQGNVQPDLRRQPRRDIGILGEDIGTGRHQQDIIIGEADTNFFGRGHNRHTFFDREDSGKIRLHCIVHSIILRFRKLTHDFTPVKEEIIDK